MSRTGIKAPYDRERILAAAVKARRKGKRKKALDLYQRVLEWEPHNFDLHRRTAPLLAQTRQPEGALKSFQLAAAGLAEKGFSEQAIGVYKEAVHYLPLEVDAWEAIAYLQVELQRKHDAVKTLLDGRKHFRGRKQRSEAIRLLVGARKVDPDSYEATLELARTIGRSNRARATRLFEHAAARCSGRKLRRVRGAQFRVTPTPRLAWRWFRALLLGR
jgi:tetratricopeptide (TPR) repeat protein